MLLAVKDNARSILAVLNAELSRHTEYWKLLGLTEVAKTAAPPADNQTIDATCENETSLSTPEPISSEDATQKPTGNDLNHLNGVEPQGQKSGYRIPPLAVQVSGFKCQ